jgi:hypothetical protein
MMQNRDDLYLICRKFVVPNHKAWPILAEILAIALPENIENGDAQALTALAASLARMRRLAKTWVDRDLQPTVPGPSIGSAL